MDELSREWRGDDGRFAKRLRAAMKQRGVKAATLARQVGILRTSLSQYMHGKQVPPLPVAVALAQALGVTLDELVGLPPPARGSQEAVEEERVDRLTVEVARTQAVLGALGEVLMQKGVMLPEDFAQRYRQYLARAAARLDLAVYPDTQTAAESPEYFAAWLRHVAHIDTPTEE